MASSPILAAPVDGSPPETAGALRRRARLLADLAVSLAIVGLCVGAYRFGLMGVIESFGLLDETQVTFIRRIGVVGALIGGYALAAGFYERRRFPELALRPAPIAAWALAGAALIGLTVLALAVVGGYEVVSVRSQSAWLGVAGAILTAAILEEVVFRGIVFRLIEDREGTIRALVVQALLFGGLHLFNEGASATTLLSVTLIGAFWTLIYVQSRNLWAVAANHFAWNTTIFLSGLPLSGREDWRAVAPVEAVSSGPPWLTGGAFGPEDSIVTLVVMTGVIVGLGWVLWRGGRIRRAPGGGVEGRRMR